jgi:hypothetical protein
MFMENLNVLKEDGGRCLVSAKDLFALVRREKARADERDCADAFRLWLADRIVSFELEEGLDYFIYMSAGSVLEMLKYESAPAEARRLLESQVGRVTDSRLNMDAV